eukprot:m.87368 g.87368  ORF g.87368 m.87368 type:complete len:69 (+) comp13104_c0_seq4:2878-3084(+)
MCKQISMSLYLRSQWNILRNFDSLHPLFVQQEGSEIYPFFLSHILIYKSTVALYNCVTTIIAAEMTMA